MKKIRYLILFFILLFSHSIFAQNEKNSQVIKDEIYNNEPLADVLADLSKKHGILLKYNEADLKGIMVSQWFRNMSFEAGLKEILKNPKSTLKYFIDNEGIINIVQKTQKVEKDKLFVPKKEILKAEKQNFTLSGRIIDASTNESLPYASVGVKSKKSLAVSTNVDGYFTLLGVPSDTVQLVVSYIGYRTLLYQLTPQTPIDNCVIELISDAEALDEVTITAEKTEVLKANEIVGMIKMTPRNIAKLPNVGERDPFRAFQLMPGVSASNESSSGLYVRGGTPDQTLVLYDGFTVYHVDHLFGFFSAFNYNAIKDIQLYKGGFDAKFGGRISGVAEITGKEGDKKKLNAGVDVGLLSVNGFVETPIGKNVTFLAAARRSWKGPLYTKIFEKFTAERATQTPAGPGGGFPGGGRGNNFVTTTQASSYFYDLNAKLTYRPTKKDIISLSFFNGTDNMDNSTTTDLSAVAALAGRNINLNTSSNDISDWGNTGGSLKWSKKWSDKFYSNTLLSYSDYFSNRDNSRNLNIRRPGTDSTQAVKLGQLETNTVQDLTAKIDFEYKLNSANQIDFGLQMANNTVKYNYTQNDTISVLDRNDSGQILSGYIQDQLKFLGGNLIVKPGLRYNYYSSTKKSYIEPRLSANWNLTKQFKLKGAAGVYHQFIKQINREDITQGNRNFWILANESTLPVTRSIHYIAGAAYETPNYLFDVEFYQKQNTGISEYSLRFVPQIGRALKASETFFNGDETIKGLDVLVQRKFGAINGWLGYTISEAKRNIAAFSDKPYYSDQDVRHQFKTAAMYNIKKVDFALTWIFASGRPYTSILGAYDLKLLDGSFRSYTNPSDKNANRFANYHRMDASMTVNMNKNLSITGSVFNVYNRTNIWYKRFQIIREDGISFLQTTDVTYLGITPNVMISWKLK